MTPRRVLVVMREVCDLLACVVVMVTPRAEECSGRGGQERVARVTTLI